MAYNPPIPNKVSTVSFNSRAAATLAAGATFEGVSEDVSKYGRAGVAIKTDNATDGTLWFEVSHDGINWSTIPRTWSDTRFSQPHMWNIVEKYFRIRYVNGATEATNLSIQVQYSNNVDILLGHQLDETLLDETEAIITRSVSVGQNPNGAYNNLRGGGYENGFSTNTPLGISGVYDSGIADIEGYTQLWTEIYSDVAGTLVGTWYDDVAGTNVLRTFTAPYDPAEDLFYSTTVVLGKYLRYTFTNGTSAQSIFHMRLKLDNTAYSGQMLKVESFIPTNVLAQLTRSVLVGKNTDGSYHNVQVNKGNALLTGDFFSEVALGNIPNYEIATKFGRNSQVDTVTVPEDMWANGGTYTGFPVSFTPETVDVFSSSTNDTSAGTGARTIQIKGLKTSTSSVEETENITLNGTTAVTSISTWWRINRVKVLTAGTGDQNAGNVTVRSTTTTANVFAVMPLGFNQSTIGAYTVPFDKTMIIKRVRVTITRSNGSAGSATISLRIRPIGGVFNAARVFELQTGGSTSFESLGGLIAESGSDVKYRIDNVSDNGTIAEGAFEYVLIDN
jgi:hypothetical protein